ncbi:MAG TPA: tetratricopeptide repeat protein [Methylomirabilota bacterium]|nr:tetratricopeptide repeat protein [Methylomirabilota bacterium]
MAFLPALQGQFLNWDDSTLFTKNPEYRGLGLSQLRWMFTTTLGGHYIPITWITLGFNYVLGGMNPWGYHLLAILLHTLNAGLFYLVAVRLLGAALGQAGPTAGSGSRQAVVDFSTIRAGAAVAALVFAVHPQRVESVAWITDRGTLVSGALYLLAVLAYLRAVESPALRWRWWGVASLAAFAAALLSKGMAISLPVTLLILDVYPLRRWDGRWRSVLREKIPYIIVAILGAAVVLFARTRGAHLSAFTDYGLDARLAFIGYSLWFYPASLIWPAGLSPLYEVPAHASVLRAPFRGAMLGLGALTILLVVLRHRFPGGLAAWIHSAAVAAPVSGIAHSGTQLVSDRYNYLAGLGFALIAGYAVAWAGRLRRQGRLSPWVSTVGAVGVVLVLAVLALGTWGQSGLWRDSETLWRWAAEQDPACATCHAGLGEAILYGTDSGRARLDESEAHERRAIALRPTLPFPHFVLGTILLVRGRYAEAEASLQTYMRLAPHSSQGPARLALVYLVQDRVQEAVLLLRRGPELGAGPHPFGPAHEPATEDPEFALALRLLGDNREDLEYLGQALIQRGKGARAVPTLRRAVALAPEAASPRFWLIRAYQDTGQNALAEEELGVLRRLDPRAAAAVPVR